MNRLVPIALLALTLAGWPVRAEGIRLERTRNIDGAIGDLLENGLRSHGIKPRPSHKMLKVVDLRWELATAIEDATWFYPRISPYLLIAIGFREGSFDNKSLGKIGEKTTFQMTPQNVRAVQRIEPRCNDDSFHGSAFCAATLLNHLVGICGTVSGAVLYYATGYTCQPRPERKKQGWIIRDRMGIADKLEKMVAEEGEPVERVEVDE